ncbi:MAG: Fe-S cluster assembly ATPase SufC [Rhodospirillaceae bacterium]|nr:Fe-S cluster assembly ATPase SufC [Rhodospirillaceae bacterium]
MNNYRLEIKDLVVKVEDKLILNGLTLSMNKGETHAIMGPNGSGKSTLSNILAGKSGYDVVSGSINFCGNDLLLMSPEERAVLGVFLSFQYPLEIPGITIINFLKTAYNSLLKARGKDEISASDFLKLIRDKQRILEISDEMTRRNLNVSFSGGEKKRMEMLQMLLLDPYLTILDETDSGLDVDALKSVSNAINLLRSKNKFILVITHYQRLLNYVIPDYVHILYKGKIIKTGNKQLALDIEKNGYSGITEAA